MKKTTKSTTLTSSKQTTSSSTSTVPPKSTPLITSKSTASVNSGSAGVGRASDNSDGSSSIKKSGTITTSSSSTAQQKQSTLSSSKKLSTIGKSNSVDSTTASPKAAGGESKSNHAKQTTSTSVGDKASKNIPSTKVDLSQKDRPSRSITKSPGIPNSQPKESKSSITKPKSSRASSKPLTSHATIPKASFKDIPSDVIILILDFYGGIFKKKPVVTTETEGKLNHSKFMKKYYGRFLDKSVKLLYRFIEGDFEEINEPREIAELLRLPLLTMKNRDIRLEGSLASYLFNCPLKGSPDVAMQKLASFVSQLREECKKVKVLDAVNLETVVAQFELAFKSFPLLEVFRGGKNMIKAKYTDHAARFHYFEEEMTRALEHGGSNVKEITWVGSMIPKALPSITPNLEILSVECPSSILGLSNAFSMWQKLREISYKKNEIYIDYNPPPVNVAAYNTLVNHLNSMENLEKLTIKSEESFPMQSLKLLEHKRSITHLNFSLLKIENDFVKTIGTFSNLKEIKIYSAYFQSKALENWLDLKQLESISLDCCSELTELALDYISQMTNLKRLCFCNRNIKDKGALKLVSLKKLEYLDLSYALVTSSCVEPIFKSCRKLKTFILRSCKNLYPENMKEELKRKITI